MTIIVENGSIVSGANSYVTDAELTAYAAARGVTLTGTAELLLVKAMDYLATLEDSWQGSRVSAAQSLAWPRQGVSLYGFAVASDAIPQSLKDGQCQLAIDADTQDLMPNVAANATGSVIREKVDVIEVAYSEGSGNTQPVFTAANRILKPLMRNTGGASNFAVTRV